MKDLADPIRETQKELQRLKKLNLELLERTAQAEEKITNLRNEYGKSGMTVEESINALFEGKNEILKRAEVAEILNVSENHVSRLAAAKKIRVININGVHRYSAMNVRGYLLDLVNPAT